jgi:hypothetical protein
MPCWFFAAERMAQIAEGRKRKRTEFFNGIKEAAIRRFAGVNHQLESPMQEICQSGSEGGAKHSFVPTPINSENLAFACYHCNLHKGPNLSGIDQDSGALVRLCA